MFEKTACFGDDVPKENQILSIILPMEQKRKVSFDLSPGKVCIDSKGKEINIT